MIVGNIEAKMPRQRLDKIGYMLWINQQLKMRYFFVLQQSKSFYF